MSRAGAAGLARPAFLAPPPPGRGVFAPQFRPVARRTRRARVSLPRATISRRIDADDIDIRDGVPGGRGVVAARRISGGAVVARVPEEAALVVYFADALPDSATDGCPFPAGAWVSSAYWRVADWDAKLAALLLFHRAEGSSSPWAGYIASLPDPTELWTAADLPSHAALDLQYTPMLDAVEVYRFRLVEEFARLQAALPPHRRACVSDDDFAWAMKVVHSRAFSIPPGGFAASATRTGLRGARDRTQRAPAGMEWPRKFALVPLLDMMNHGSGDQLAKFRFDAAESVFELVAGPSGYEGGNQVLVSYGDLTNDDLLLLYGFVQAGNPSDVYEVEDVTDWVIDHPSNSDWNLYQRKVAILESAGLCYEGRKFFISRTAVDEHLIAALRILLASPKELSSLARAVETTGFNTEPPRMWYAPVSEENELQVWSAVERHCDRMLAEFPTSLDADEEMIILLAAGSAESDVSVSAPLLFRVEKKRILRDAVQLAAVKQLCVATNASKESERSLLREVSNAKPPPPETWKKSLLHGSNFQETWP